MNREILEILLPISLFFIVAGYALALTLSRARYAKLDFLSWLLRQIGEMSDPFYTR